MINLIKWIIFYFIYISKLHHLSPKSPQQDNLRLSCRVNNHLPRQLYCLTEVKRKAVGQFRIVLPIDPNQHSKTILLCLTESTSTAMTIDCPTELHCQDNHIVWPSVLCQDNIFVLPKEMTSAKTIRLSDRLNACKTILNCLAECILPRPVSYTHLTLPTIYSV